MRIRRFHSAQFVRVASLLLNPGVCISSYASLTQPENIMGQASTKLSRDSTEIITVIVMEEAVPRLGSSSKNRTKRVVPICLRIIEKRRQLS